MNECIPSNGCSSSKMSCVCDGDCGYSCVKKDLDCGSPLPRRLANGNRTVRGTKFNDTATFRCYPDFKLFGSGVRQCRGKGTWDGLKPRCKIFCADPGVTETAKRNKSISFNGFKAKTVLEYYCTPNYVLSGKSIITCKDNGRWSDPAPKCVAPQCPSQTLPHNSKVISPTSYDYKSGAPAGTRLILGCEPGYFKVKAGVMHCNGSGIWEILQSLSCTPVSCGDPGVPKNGDRQGLLFHFKSKVSFVCHKCYKLVGVPYRICHANQQWSDQQPTCQRSQSCKKLSNLPHGEVSFSSTACGAKAVYSCEKGYNLVGLRERSCHKSGQWTGATPHCKIVSCGRPLTIGSVIQLNNGSVYASTVKFKCPPDYVIEGKSFATCEDNGKWSNKAPECLAPCSVKIAKNVLPNKKVYSHGERARFGCKSGLNLVGLIDNNSPRCLNGTWTPQMKVNPYCVEEKTHEKKVKNFYEKFLNLIG